MPNHTTEKLPKVSILIPTYNQAEYIEQAIRSALNQSYQNLEVIVSDDASQDVTQTIVQGIQTEGKRLQYHKNKTNLGRVANYRYALYNLAEGELVLNLDGDDYLCDNNYISEAVSLWQKNEETVLVFADIVSYFEADKSFVKDRNNKKLPQQIDGSWLFFNYTKSFNIPHMTCLYERAVALETDFYRKNIPSADWESILRLIQGRKVAYINKTAGVWRKHASNASRTIDTDVLINNAAYIESAYERATELANFTTNALNEWRQQMLKRWFLNALVKTLFINKSALPELLKRIQEYDAQVFRSINSDFRWKAFQHLALSPKLLIFIFKYFLGQKSFVLDLLQY